MRRRTNVILQIAQGYSCVGWRIPFKPTNDVSDAFRRYTESVSSGKSPQLGERMKCLVLDAMGVLFQAADDVGELLIPFVAKHGGEACEGVVQKTYLEASLGHIAADEFWARVGVNPKSEDEYLSRHRLSHGVKELIVNAQHRQVPVWCLSNDVGRWSRKLREKLGLEELLSGAVISGEVSVRKPDSRIYEELISRSGFAAADMLFIDDRLKNVQAAQALGIESIQYLPRRGFDEIAKKLTML